MPVPGCFQDRFQSVPGIGSRGAHSPQRKVQREKAGAWGENV